MTRIGKMLLRNGGGTDKGDHKRPKRRKVRREEKSDEKRSPKREEDENREMGAPGSPERSPGSGTQWLDTQWLDPRGCRRDFGPSDWMGSGLPRRRDTWGLSTPAPWKRNQRLPDTRDSGIGTGGTRGGRVSRYSPIMDGQAAQLPPRRLKTPGMGVARWDGRSKVC